MGWGANPPRGVNIRFCQISPPPPKKAWNKHFVHTGGRVRAPSSYVGLIILYSMDKNWQRIKFRKRLRTGWLAPRILLKASQLWQSMKFHVLFLLHPSFISSTRTCQFELHWTNLISIRLLLVWRWHNPAEDCELIHTVFQHCGHVNSLYSTQHLCNFCRADKLQGQAEEHITLKMKILILIYSHVNYFI